MRLIRLGGGGLPITYEDPWELARAHKDFGYRAAYCPDVELQDATRVQEIRNAFDHENVLIAEVGAWCNLIGPDEAERNRNLNYVCERLALADEIGARCCIDFIGSVAPNLPNELPHAPHPANLDESGFDLCVETIRRIIDNVKPKRAKFCLEFMQWVLPDSPETCLHLIHAVDRPEFAAHIDPVNIILTPRQYFNNSELIGRCFELLGPWIVSCHAKDITLRNQLALHFDEVRVGLGNLNYETYLTELDKLPGDVPLLLEHLTRSEDYAAARDHLIRVGSEVGVQFC